MLLSIIGLYEYDNNLFQGLQLPEGLDRDSVINEILLQCAELEIVYPNIDIMKLAITTWSVANQYTWQKLYDTMVVKYNPIWNVDATVVIDRDTSGSGNATDAVKGFNSNTWAESDKTDTSSSASEDVTETRTGNIGVTTTQQMLEQERKIADFNMISYIAQSFKQRFCLLIY